jgi:hypothetical protein
LDMVEGGGGVTHSFDCGAGCREVVAVMICAVEVQVVFCVVCK